MLTAPYQHSPWHSLATEILMRILAESGFQSAGIPMPRGQPAVNEVGGDVRLYGDTSLQRGSRSRGIVEC
jgi:hypothetical protein